MPTSPVSTVAACCYRATAGGRSWPAGLPGMWGRAAGLGNIPCAGHRRTRWTWCGLQQGGGDLRLFFHCWRGHGQAPQSQALSQRLALGLLSSSFESGDCCGLDSAFGNCGACRGIDNAHLPVFGPSAVEQLVPQFSCCLLAAGVDVVLKDVRLEYHVIAPE